jgi:predicted regulator of Ras-like GTPase activity (Roadblock/LC7/MglB family)
LNNVKNNLTQIKQVRGVENVVLTQRDGNPIQYSGIWLSKKEIYNVSASTSAIYNCALKLYASKLKYLLIEGDKAKIFISPLKNYGSETINRIIDAQHLQGNSNEFYVAITTQPHVNLGGIILKIRESLIEIKKALILSGESFQPPLRHFSRTQINSLVNNSDVKEEIEMKTSIPFFSAEINTELSYNLDLTLSNFAKHILELKSSFIALEGGFIISKIKRENNSIFDLDTQATMCYSLLSTAENCAWMLKKMHVKSILMECTDSFHFINKIGKNIFSTHITKGRQKLGLLRLILPRYTKKIEKFMEEIQYKKPSQGISNIENLFSELVISR